MNSENTQVKYAQLAKKLAVCYIINRKDNRLSGSCQSNRLTPLGALSHGVHEPISVVLRTSFLDAPTTRWVAFSSFCGLKATPLPASFGVVFLCLDYLLNWNINVSNARINTPKAIRSLKSYFFISITSILQKKWKAIPPCKWFAPNQSVLSPGVH